MTLAPCSVEKFHSTFQNWEVDEEYSGTMYRYVVHGLEPGGFFTAVLANDFLGAISRSHPANTIVSLKKLAGWINEHVPKHAYGSYETVKTWLLLDINQRRLILEQHRLIYTEKEETWLALQKTPHEQI